MIHSQSHRIGGVMSPFACCFVGCIVRDEVPTVSTSVFWAVGPDGTQSTLKEQESLQTFHTPLGLLA